MIEPVRKEKVQQTLTRCWALTSLARRFPYVFEKAEGVDIVSPAERGRLFFFALATLEAIRKLRAKVIYGKECV